MSTTSTQDSGSHGFRRFISQLFSIGFAGLIVAVVLGLVAHQDSVRLEFIGVRAGCASDLSGLIGVLSTRAALADQAAREEVPRALIAASESDAATAWNLVAASCYQYGLLTESSDDPVGRSFALAQAASVTALAPDDNTMTDAQHVSTGANLVIESGYWALAALAQVRASAPSDKWWWPFDPPSRPRISDFAFG